MYYFYFIRNSMTIPKIGNPLANFTIRFDALGYSENVKYLPQMFAIDLWLNSRCPKPATSRAPASDYG